MHLDKFIDKFAIMQLTAKYRNEVHKIAFNAKNILLLYVAKRNAVKSKIRKNDTKVTLFF